MENKEENIINNEACTCDDNCCGDNCTCGDECNCNDECKCDENCHCKEDKKKEKNKKHDKIYDLECKISLMNEALKQAQDATVRSQAELVNYRKRKDEEVSKLLLYCNESIVKELLPTLDNFERAIKLDDDNLEDALSKFLDGFKMIYCSMINTLEKYDVKAIECSNQPFDPKYHQAVLMEHRDDVEPGIVLEVLQKGYMLKDRVIRPAMVRVSE